MRRRSFLRCLGCGAAAAATPYSALLPEFLGGMHNACVFVTNQVQADPAQFFGDPTKAVGGHIVAHASTFRIYLRKGKKGSRVAKLIDAPNLADGECNFMVEESGFRDL